MPRKKKSKEKVPKPETGKTLGRELNFTDSFFKDYRALDNNFQKRIDKTLERLQKYGFTPGMKLKPLPQERIIKYFRVGKDIRITITIDYENDVEIICLRRIKTHDDLHLNP